MQSWNLEGLMITASYLDSFHVSGTVAASRVKYGGGICHTVVLNNPITVYGTIRNRVIVEHQDVTKIMSNID